MIERMAPGATNLIQEIISTDVSEPVQKKEISQSGLHFDSYLGGGFDSPAFTVRTSPGMLTRYDILAASEHDKYVATDYAMLEKAGIRWVREDARWHTIAERNGVYDFASLDPMIMAGQEFGIQQIWSLSHYSHPESIDPFSPDFPQQLSSFGLQFLDHLERQGVENSLIIPINEPSFWAHMIDSRLWHTHPEKDYSHGLFKNQLIAAHKQFYTDAKKDFPKTNVLICDPSYYVVGADDRPRLIDTVKVWQDVPFSAVDSLVNYVDVIGVNYYKVGQVEMYIDPETDTTKTRELAEDDPRRITLFQALQRFQKRYPGKELLITETGNNEDPIGWLREVADNLEKALRSGIRVRGTSIYPIANYPDWDAIQEGRVEMNPCGMIQLSVTENGIKRSIVPELFEEIQLQEKRLQKIMSGN